MLCLSLGKRTVYAVTNVLDLLSAPVALGQQAASINKAMTERPWIDLAYQTTPSACHQRHDT